MGNNLQQGYESQRHIKVLEVFYVKNYKSFMLEFWKSYVRSMEHSLSRQGLWKYFMSGVLKCYGQGGGLSILMCSCGCG